MMTTLPSSSGEQATPLPLENWIKAQAYALGFDLAGIAVLGPADTGGHFDAWLAAGYAGEMDYMALNADKRRDSRLPVPGTVSAIVVGLNYGGTAPSGPIARYARGDDYHDVMLAKLRELHRQLAERVGREIHGKPYVDTGPVLERELARRAGLGWFGKNANLINPKIGSYFFIGSLFTDLPLQPDAPFDEDRCGTCRRCLDACPTHAFVAPRVLDSRKCISYLTIELRGEIPEELRAPIGDRIYGCDVCQEVCPWNEKFSVTLAEDSPFAAREAFERRDARWLARALLATNQEQFSAEYRGSPMKRARLRGLKRNAAVVLGNVGTIDDLDLLLHAHDDPEPVVRAHAAGAGERIRTRDSMSSVVDSGAGR